MAGDSSAASSEVRNARIARTEFVAGTATPGPVSWQRERSAFLEMAAAGGQNQQAFKELNGASLEGRAS